MNNCHMNDKNNQYICEKKKKKKKKEKGEEGCSKEPSH